MPTWLVHGFRWPRPLVRIHIILHNLEDAATEWLMAPGSTASLTESFQTLYPEQMASLPSLRFIEQYDPEDTTIKDQPFAYVCDQVHEVQLSVDIDEVRGKGVANDAWSALADLRDKIAPGEKVGWFIVVNGDVERWAPPLEDTVIGSADESQVSPISQRSSVGRVEEEYDSDQTQREQPRGFKKWFSGKARKSKSSRDLRGDMAIRTAPLSPPPPPVPRNGLTPGQKATAPLPKGLNGKAPVGTAV
ncbi:hypothetical protein K491DRAFT_664011 [Lophiostoma macrostomum CBS 122681]|uniref:Developmental regulator n=1 Tax=Lophiostoma macrostomum CBS 122681 TaxID=1314788 RepID=A0A6A6SX31_9PLEO|nr:hypothetical protein K491DRAFT_664011 [Lophiostoma macrostomum CBS 122681]